MTSPTAGLPSSRPGPTPPFPPSPEMKSARKRLGNLLHGMRGVDCAIDGGSQQDLYLFDEIEPGRDRVRRNLTDDATGDKKATRRERKVLYELRSKPFELRDRGHEQALYELCRVWVHGNDPVDANNDDENTDEQHPPPDEHTLDLLATKDIHALPRRSYDIAVNQMEMPELPLHEQKDDHNLSPQQMLAQYKQHWKNVKRVSIENANERAQPYHKSLHLLKTVFDIAQQNPLISG